MTLYKGNKVIAGSRSYIGNIGDIKYTTRVDLPFGGSWCDGSIKLKAQFPTVYQMLIDGKLQALDIATYESALNLNGSCGFFGLDTATESFRVPSLNDVYIKSGQVADEFGAESLPNITGSLENTDKSTSSNTGGEWVAASFKQTGALKTTSFVTNEAIAGSQWTGGQVIESISFNASRSSPTYQDGAKVNPDHVKYRAYVVLYTEEKEIAIYDYTDQIEAKTEECIERIDEKADSYLDNSMITNCITEIPQDIKLELNNGVISVKAGSKIRYPDGKNEDGSLRFGEIVLESDVIFNYNGTGSSDVFLLYNTTSSALTYVQVVNGTSGTTAPTGTGNFYNTDDNTIKYYNNGTPSDYAYAFPLAIMSRSGNTITGIKQVFNGFGYIGSDVYILPNLKIAIPDGRNDDGSLRNIMYTTDKVQVIHNPDSDDKLQYLMIGVDGYIARANWYNERDTKPDFRENNNNWWYNPKENRFFYYRSSDSSSYIKAMFSGVTFRGSQDSEKISEFNIGKQTIEVVDYSMADYVVETYYKNGNWYRLYKSGWVEQGGKVSVPGSGGVTIQLHKKMKDGNYSTMLTGQTYSGGNMVNDYFWVLAQSQTSINIDMHSGSNSNWCAWEVKGQGA